MARVSRATAASNRRQSIASKQASELYPSINTLKSELEADDSDHVTCGQWLKTCCTSLFDFTVASCECFTWFMRRRKGYRTHPDMEDSVEDLEIAVMKEKLNFHFMNPFQKWKYPRKRRFPWKLLVQLCSIILVTTQLVLFAGTKFALTTFILENQSTFVQLFVEKPPNPDPDDPLPSPLATLFTHKELQSQFNYTINQYFNLDNLAAGTYGYSWDNLSPEITLVIEKYKNASIDPAAKMFSVYGGTVQEVHIISSADEKKLSDIRKKLKDELIRTVRVSQFFNITSIFVGSKNTAECVQFYVELRISNDRLSGNLPVTMTAGYDIAQCNNDTTPFKSESTVLASSVATVVDAVVILFALISIFQCVRSLLSSARLAREVKKFFLTTFDYRLKYHQILPLFNMWFIGVIISNLLVLLGCILKMLIAYNLITNLLLVDLTSIAIGLAVFGQWSGLLRFLSYLDKYNMLLITLRLSLPSVIRFIICTGILYIAFLLCGWLVLGPYHPKFRDPFTTSDCLFSLINGDDMFATYKGMSQTSMAAYVFCKIYLYVFIALFIYVVLSVFISLISDTYETLHEHWYERSKGLLIDFATGNLGKPHHHHPPGSALAHSDILHDDHTQEEDFEYLREASQRFDPPPPGRARSRSEGEQSPQVQVHNRQFIRSGSFET